MNPKTHWVPKKNIPHMILKQIIFEHELRAPFNGAGTVSCNKGLSQYRGKYIYIIRGQRSGNSLAKSEILGKVSNFGWCKSFPTSLEKSV